MFDYSWERIEKVCIDYQEDNFDFQNKQLVLFGLGMQGTFAIDYFKNKSENIYLADNNKELWGKSINGFSVISPSRIQELDNPFVIVTTATRNYSSVFKQLNEMELQYMSLFQYLFIENIALFKNIYEEFWYDEKSKEVWIALIYGKLRGNLETIKEVYSADQYFAISDFNRISNESIAIDCGAYVGDSLENFIYRNVGIFKKIYAFEPGIRQFEAMKSRCDRLIKEWALRQEQIVLENVGIGKRESQQVSIEFVDATISASASMFSQNQMVTLVSLDKYFEKSEERVTLIKADIEGFEMDMLKGAKSIIQKYKPNLAICVYHKPMDLIEIPMYLRELVPEYKMSLRHHSISDEETVLYCYV